MLESVYALFEARGRADVDAIVDLLWQANYDPYSPIIQVFFPVLGPTLADYETAVQESKDRTWNDHIENPNSHWLYVTHKPTGKIVGAGEWLVFTESPWPNGPPKLDATWWPEGEGREFVNEMLRQVFDPRCQWCNRPHLAMNETSVDIEHRRKGVGSMIMEWGIAKADELKLESFIESTDMGRPLYEKFGYRTFMKIQVCPEKKNPGQQWKRVAFEMTPLDFYVTWRPVGGIFEEGKPQAPWQVDQILARRGEDTVSLNQSSQKEETGT